MTPQELRDRTKRFAVRTVRFCRALPDTWDGREIGRQLIRASTSTYANYRATCRGRSRPDFIAKLALVCEESDESLGWLELIEALNLAESAELRWLQREADELVSIFSASLKTARTNRHP